MGFLVPLFALGAGLVVVPWIVHRIRRPERETVRFSSLMFVPDVRKEVIERRRVQHLLLMLLRMLLLLLLAFAFTRPYWKIPRQAVAPDDASQLHVVLLDTSLSMQVEGVLEQSKKRAQAILDDLPNDARVGVVAFARTSQVLAPLLDPNREATGSVSDARRAIESVQATWEETDYTAGLQAAEALLMEYPDQDVQRRVHLVSDLQETGMLQVASGWRLSSDIALDTVVVGKQGSTNYAVQALMVQPLGEDQLQVRVRIKNWSGGSNQPVTVNLVLEDKVADSRALTVLPGHASQARFTFPWNGQTSLTGHVALGPDDLLADNRRYFAWNPRSRSQVTLVKERRTGEQWGYDRLIQAAIPTGTDLPWRLTAVSSGELDLASSEIVILGSLPGADAATRLRSYVEQGGKVLCVLHSGSNTAELNQLLLGTGIQIMDLRFSNVAANRFEILSWVDLEHRIFHPFRGARFNDFSGLRFQNYFRLNVTEDAHVIARFDNGDSAMADVPIENGRMMLWTGGIEPSWTNLAKRPRFLPLLHETLMYLGGDHDETTDYAVGEALARVKTDHHVKSDWRDSLRFNNAEPHPDPQHFSASAPSHFRQPGIVRWQEPPGNERVIAVNVAAGESDPSPITPSEFGIRLCDAPAVSEPQTVNAGIGELQPDEVCREYGLWLIGCVLVLLVLESSYAAWLAQKSRRDT